MKMTRAVVFAGLAIALSLSAFSCNDASRLAGDPHILASGAPLPGINPSEFDPTSSPRDDFFAYVNDKWIATHPIPADEHSWGVDYEVTLSNQQALRSICEELAADPKATGIKQKIRDFWITAMDQAKLEKDGLAPLKPDLALIDAIQTIADLPPVLTRMQLTGATTLFGIYVDQDQKRSDEYAFYMIQAGTALPEREYYLGADEDSKRIRDEYVDHVKKMFMLAGEAEPAALRNARVILAIETRLAEAQWTPVQLRDPIPQYNKTSRIALAQLCPSINWDAYFAALGKPDIKEVIVCQLDFMKRVDDVLKKTPITDLKAYLRWLLINHASPRLSDAVVEEDFRFFGTVLGGAKQLKPRWKRTVDAIDAQIGEGLGQLFVEKHFPPDAKRKVNDLVTNIVAAFGQRIQSREWMSPITRDKALAKLSAIERKLGYPDKWRDYSALEIKTDSYLENTNRATLFESRRKLAQLGTPVDRSEWGTTPPTVNAYYNQSSNDITFPAGILQPPFFDPNVDDAINYGSIGSIIGHELTHGFDDEGRKYDGKGNLTEWWTKEDTARFDARAARIMQQFTDCIAIGNIHINGELTQGENIADLGGLAIAFDAWKRSLKGKPAPIINGLTGEQRFFLGFAISWRDNVRPEQQKTLLRTDPHAPPRFRVIVPLSNMAEFHKAFGVRPGDKMWRDPKERAEVW